MAGSPRPAAEDDPFLTPREAAELLGVHDDTVTRWADRGALPVAFRTPGGHRRFRRSDVEALMASSIADRRAMEAS